MSEYTTPDYYQKQIQSNEPINNDTKYQLTSYKHRLNPESKQTNDKYLRTYTLVCPKNHVTTITDSIHTPNHYTKRHSCWCMENNPIRRERRRLELSIEDVAKYMELSTITIIAWENTIRTIPLHRAEALIQLYQPIESTKQAIYDLVSNQWNSQYEPPILGKKYGELTVIEDYRTNNKRTKDKIKVECGCGKVYDIRIEYLITGQAKSCGHRTDEVKKQLRNMQLQKPSIYLKRINKPKSIGNQYTLTEFSDHNRSDDGKRLYTYTLECKCGRQYHKTDTYLTPNVYAKRRTCECEHRDTLIKERQRNNYTREDVAKILKTSPKHIKIWENLEYDISQENLQTLFKLYNTPNRIRGHIYRYKDIVGSKILHS